MKASSTKSENLESRTARSAKNLSIWTFAWVTSLAVVAFGPKFVWEFNVVISLIAISINLGFGYKMIMANISHFNSLDEMQRKIHINAMALTLGVSVVFGAIYGLLKAIQLISFEPNPSGILFVMSFSYMIGIAIFNRKYA